jgi:hypothetical protein
MTAKVKRRLAVGISAVLLVLFVMGQVDFERVVQRKKPLFARWSMHPADGGSHEYPFVGYTVAYMHRLDGMTPDGRRYRVGPKLDYWLPFVGRDHTALIVRTNQPANVSQ